MGEADKFDRLLRAANEALNTWFEDGSPYNPAMIELHCAARALDAPSVRTRESMEAD